MKSAVDLVERWVGVTVLQTAAVLVVLMVVQMDILLVVQMVASKEMKKADHWVLH